MTLDTRVLFDGPISGPDAFDLMLGALLDAADRGDERTTAQVRRSPTSIHTVLGQGLPGITDVTFAEDGLLPRIVEDEGTEDEWVAQHACSVSGYWDTAYSYGDNGLSCTMLHASALIHLAERLPAGVTLRWKNEYAGTWHDGVQPDDLETFLGHGDGASAWFTDTVLPAIKALGGEVQ